MTSTSDLLSRDCAARPNPLSTAELGALLPLVPGWRVVDGKLSRNFTFNNYYQTMAFVNALAYFTHAQDHHPELTISYKTCLVKYDTHALANGQGGLSDNDFICAAKADALYRGAAA